MLKFNTASLLKVLLFLPFFTAILFSYYHVKKWRYNKKFPEKNQLAGKQFVLANLTDSAGHLSVPDFRQSDVNIIDFWFKSCPTCIDEMKQFETLLKGLEEKVTITSISIDNFDTWRSVLQGQNKRLDFIARPVANWKHLDMVSAPADSNQSAYTVNSTFLRENFGVTSYPGVFVVDRNGKIIAAPESAVAYIKTTISNENGFAVFITSVETWTSTKIILLLLVSIILYNWIYKKIAAAMGAQK